MGDDDTILIRRKIARAAAVLVKPLPVKVWHLALVLAAGFGLGAWLV